jgi:hypothetical protein
MMAYLVPKGGVYAEIGVFKGEFARDLLRILEPTKLVLIDFFSGRTCSGDADGNGVRWTDMNEEYNKIIAWNDTRLELQRGDSSTMLNTYPDETFDMIYIDGDHSYGGCKKDLEVAYKKIKRGGWIMGHDYEMNMAKARTIYNFGVKRAVDEFCAEKKLRIAAKGADGCVSYAIKIEEKA